MAGTVLQGVPPVSYASGERFTPIGALNAVAEFLEIEATYPLLMGCSGAAFRTCWSDNWSLEMTYAAPDDLVTLGAQEIGLAAENRLNGTSSEIWEVIVESLEESLPLLSCGLAGAPEFCVIYGYATDPQSLWVTSYFEPAAHVPYRPWMGWHYGGYGSFPLVRLRRAEAPEEPITEGCLRRALAFSRGEGPLAESGRAKGLHFGLSAYDAWVHALESEEGDLESRAYNLALTLNAVTDARRTAGEFLLMLGAIRDDLRQVTSRAADHYRHQVAALAQARKLIYYPFDLGEKAAAQAATELADPERREGYARIIKAAKAEELLSLEWIEKALE